MIRVFNIPAITWALTVVLLLGGTWHTIQAIHPTPARARTQTRGVARTQLGRISARYQGPKRAQMSPSWAGRVNQGLHALMHLLMAAMLWNAAPTTTLLQILLLAGAALWFIIQAVARPQYRTLCTGTRDRIKCTYHALTMAAAAIMIAMMTNHTTPATPTAPSTATAHTHHTTTATGTSTGSASIFQNTPALATILTIAFTAAATIFLILLLRRTHTTTTHHHTKNTRTEHGLEAAGATTMALMFATMTT
ncbi:DUF5134 domain-containing protein [Paenarthrobacter sp. NPDC058040]|uniref:DUF5134 domain-containing protein n=1 Tax=unclassified Paenarthrobacter TaxID=2634190 RepID=UPI0036DBA0DD